MLEIRVGKDEPIERALRRFRKRCDKENLIKEMKKRKHYVKPSEKRRRQLLKGQKKGRRI